MKLSEFRVFLNGLDSLTFRLPDQQLVPSHFHITEVGLVSKHFIDCGSTVRTTTTASLQIWVANDIDHRLSPKKLLSILDASHTILNGQDPELEIEYQTETIGRYSVVFNNQDFILQNTYTDCLAKEACGIPEFKPKKYLSELGNSSCCSPNQLCCS